MEPLTPAFLSSTSPTDTPSGHHPATPRFLLSLLATAVYLSIPSTASQALTAILSTVGPYTVVDYLNFALGKPISDLAGKEPIAAVGLEDIAQDLNQELSDVTPPEAKPSTIREKSLSGTSGVARKVDPSASSPQSGCRSLCSHTDDADANDQHREPLFLYGAISNKIGEASVCWLARWGLDMFTLEFGGSDATTWFLTQRLSDVPGHLVPTIWRRGGLSAKWVSALISSDMLFVRGERERYKFAKAVVELRRRDGVDEREEEIWTKMFNHSIYYANMVCLRFTSSSSSVLTLVQPIEELIAISQDISPTTGQPYVSMSALQSAHWYHSMLRHHITTKPSGFGIQGSQRDKELGITFTTTNVLHMANSLRRDAADQEKIRQKLYYRIPSDTSSRLGENGKIEASSMDQLFEVSSLAYNPKGSSAITSCASTHEGNFFGLQSDCVTASSCISADPTGNVKWSPYPPVRFAVEFWGVHNLREKTPLHSHTIWYAGSYFNVYVQLVRKKGMQLGMYLHRQSSIDPMPSPSVPTSLVISAERLRNSPMPASSDGAASRVALSNPSSSTTSFRTSPSRTATPPAPTSPLSPAFTLLPSPPRTVPAQPYRDPRSSVSAYFVVSCASATGSAMTRFSSAPDVFAVGQSWGWKSGSLLSEGWEGEVEGADDMFASAGPEVSLRATVVLGVI